MEPSLFAFSDLQKATRDFHPDNKLGEGGFGAVYKVVPFHIFFIVISISTCDISQGLTIHIFSSG